MSADYTPQFDMGHLYQQRLVWIIPEVPHDILGRAVYGYLMWGMCSASGVQKWGLSARIGSLDGFNQKAGIQPDFSRPL